MALSQSFESTAHVRYRAAALTDDDGNIVEAYDTDAYGNTLIFDAPGTGSNWWADDASATNNPINPYIFTGRQYDPESQIYYYRARYYQPVLGRFISRDPIGYKDSINLYEYGQSQPAGLLDPSGDICLSCYAIPLEFALYHAALLEAATVCGESETPLTAAACLQAIAVALGAGTAFFLSMADCLSCLSEDYCKNKDKIEKLEKELDEANKQYKAIQQKYNQLKKQLGG